MINKYRKNIFLLVLCTTLLFHVCIIKPFFDVIDAGIKNTVASAYSSPGSYFVGMTFGTFVFLAFVNVMKYFKPGSNGVVSRERKTLLPKYNQINHNRNRRGKDKFTIFASMSLADLKRELLQACETGDLEKVRFLVNIRRVSMCILDDYENIKVTLENGNNQIAAYLFEEGKKREDACRQGIVIEDEFIRKQIGCEDKRYYERLFSFACYKGDVNVARFICGKSTIKPTEEDWQIALLSNNQGIAHYILNVIRTSNEQEIIAVFRGARNKGYAQVIKFLYDNIGFDDYVGKRDLLYACECGHLNLVKLLIEERNVDINTRNDRNQLSALDIACYKGRLDIVKYLIEERDDNPNKQAPNGVTPMRCANAQGHKHVCDYLSSKYGVTQIKK